MQTEMLAARMDKKSRSPKSVNAETAKRLRKLEKDLRGLTDDVRTYLKWLDEEMRKPSSPQRGSRIARASNSLEMRNNMVRRFTLGIFDSHARSRPDPKGGSDAC